MTKSKQVVYQDNEYVIFEDGSGGAIMSNEEIEDAEKFDEWFNSLTKEEQDAYIQDLKDHGLLDEDDKQTSFIVCCFLYFTKTIPLF